MNQTNQKIKCVALLAAWLFSSGAYAQQPVSIPNIVGNAFKALDCANTPPPTFDAPLFYGTDNGSGLGGTGSGTTYFIRKDYPVTGINNSLTQFSVCARDANGDLTGAISIASINVLNLSPGATGVGGGFRGQVTRADGTTPVTAVTMMQVADSNDTALNAHWKFQCAVNNVLTDCGSITPQGFQLSAHANVRRKERSDYACINDAGLIFRSASPCN